MEITIKHYHGQITMREPFFPCPLRKLKRLILPLLLEDPQGETVREQMAAYCEKQAEALRREAKEAFKLGQEDESRKLMNRSSKYRKNAEVIRG